jgi:hypothetical protein
MAKPVKALHNQQINIQLKQGLQADINTTVTKNYAVTGEPHYTTDTGVLYLFNGTENTQSGMRYTESEDVPTDVEIPNSGEFGIHKNTDDGKVYLAFNDGGTIKKVELT